MPQDFIFIETGFADMRLKAIVCMLQKKLKEQRETWNKGWSLIYYILILIYYFIIYSYLFIIYSQAA